LRKPSVFWSSNALQLVLKLLQAVLTARLAGPQNMGLYVAAIAIPLILVRVVELGLSQSLGYFTRFDRQFFAHAVRILFLHILVVLGPVLICVFLMRYYSFGDGQVNDLVRSYMLAIVISVMAQLFTGIVTPMLVAVERGRSYGFVALAPPLLFMGLMLALHTAQVHIASYVLIMCDAFANGVTALAVAALAWKWRARAAQSAVGRREVYSYALQAYPGILSKVVALRLDRVVLAALLPPSALALYSIATSLRDVAMTPSNIFSVTFQNELVDEVKQGGPYRKTTARTMAVWFIVFSAGNLVFWLISPWLLPLVYGKVFSPVVPVARILMVSTLFLSVAGFCWMLMVALRRPALISLSNIFGGILSIGLLWIGARAYGLIGAAWASVISSAIIMIAASATALLLRPVTGAAIPIGLKEPRTI
jgi:O-antigen/teichoic acid export membrane protein